MKNKHTFIILFIALIVIPYPVARFLFPILQNNIVEYEVSIDNIDYNNGKKTYYLKVLHWKHGDIVRSKSYFDLTEKQVDSIKIIEDEISEKYKLID